MKSRRSLVVLLTGLLATAVLPPASVAAHEDVVCDLGWFEVQLREDIAPEGVIAFDPDEPWIAGGTMLGGGRRSAAVLHGLGDDAVLEEPPLPDTRDSGLMAIGGAGPDEPLWAVGFGRETDYVAAYVARRDEDGWGRTETIRPEDFNAALTDVDADLESGAWAAGFLQGQPGDQRPWVLELREDGRTGSRPPLADDERATLAGISVSDEGGVWVAGTALTDEHMEPYLARREGDDSVGSLLVVEGAEARRGPAILERARELQVLELDVDLGAQDVAQRAAGGVGRAHHRVAHTAGHLAHQLQIRELRWVHAMTMARPLDPNVATRHSSVLARAPK